MRKISEKLANCIAVWRLVVQVVVVVVVVVVILVLTLISLVIRSLNCYKIIYIYKVISTTIKW